MELLRRFYSLPPSSAFVFGPRGSGKSTCLRHSLPDALWLNLLQPETYVDRHNRRTGRIRETHRKGVK
jgi:predicted AAA+ superfamily ATPase